MAELTLSRFELQTRHLAPVCACCGDPTVAAWKQKKFSWYPRWVFITLAAGLLIFAIVAMVTTKRAEMAIPLCERHKKHFFNRALLGWLGVAGLFGIIFLAASAHADIMLFAMPVYFIAWIVAMMIAGFSAIKAAEITDGYVRMKNLSPAFVAAHQALGPVQMPNQLGYGMPPPYGMPPA